MSYCPVCGTFVWGFGTNFRKLCPDHEFEARMRVQKARLAASLAASTTVPDPADTPYRRLVAVRCRCGRNVAHDIYDPDAIRCCPHCGTSHEAVLHIHPRFPERPKYIPYEEPLE